MKKNLSEELIINNDLEMQDNEDTLPEIEKDREELDKEVNKELEAKIKDVEDINAAEAPEIEVHDGDDKKIKVKGLTEKLILDEGDDSHTLNEDWKDSLDSQVYNALSNISFNAHIHGIDFTEDQFRAAVENFMNKFFTIELPVYEESLTEDKDWEEWTEDDYMNKYFDATHDVYDILRKFIISSRDYMHENGLNQLDTAEDVCDYALSNLEQAMNEFGELDEAVDLEEKIPADLMKAYNNARYRGLPNTDLQNAEYTEVTPEAAYKAYKADPRSVRLLINGKLIDFDATGRPSTEHRDTWLNTDKVFTNRNGKRVRDTRYIPPKSLLSIADKIYVTNENTPEGKKDQELLARRAENPESPNANSENRVSNLRSSGYEDRDGWGTIRRGSRSSSMNDYNYYKNQYERYKDKYNQAVARGDDYSASTYKDYMDNYKNDMNQILGKVKDYNARKRYASSERALQKNLQKYNSIKNNIENLQYNVDRATRTLNNVKQNGSPASQENRNKLSRLNDELVNLKKRIALVELELEETDEEDAKAVADAQRKYDQAEMAFNAAKEELNALLRR